MKTKLAIPMLTLALQMQTAYSQIPVEIYKTKEEKVYSRDEKDSIANLGYPIGIKSKTQKNDTTYFEIEIYDKSALKTAFAKRFEGNALPEVTFKDINGKEITTETLKGRVVMINFWSTTCGPCIVEMPQLNELKRQYQNDVTFIAIAPESKTKIQAFLKKHEFDFIIVSDERIFHEWEIDGYPKNLFIDKSGKIIKVKEGAPMVRESEKDEWKVGVLHDYSKILSALVIK